MVFDAAQVERRFDDVVVSIVAEFRKVSACFARAWGNLERLEQDPSELAAMVVEPSSSRVVATRLNTARCAA